MIITNCGNHGSGKSLLSVSLAKALIRRNPKTKVIIVNFDTDIPAHALWEPQRKDISKTASIGCAFEQETIDIKNLANYVVCHKNYNNIGLVGYVGGESPLVHPDATYDLILNVIKCANELSDYVIVDACSELMSESLAAAIEMSDSLNLLITPNVQGVVYFNTFQQMYKSVAKYENIVSRANVILSPVHSFNPKDVIENSLNISTLQIPYSVEIDVMAGQDEMFDVYNNAPKSYRKVADTIIERLNLRSE